MPVQMFTDGLEPADREAVIWRFMDLQKFKDLVTTGELYFRRADLFENDETEGLPPDEYLRRLGLSPFDLSMEWNHKVGSLAQFREAFFVNCWYLFAEETAVMWKEYGRDGVAVSSRYSLLKAALDSCEGSAYLGLVRYGSKHLKDWNTHRFITTKKEKYAHEREVRAAFWAPDEFATTNRHFDERNIAHARPQAKPPDRVPEFLRRKINLNTLLSEVVVAPTAAETLLEAIEQLTRNNGWRFPIRPSSLTRFKHLLP